MSNPRTAVLSLLAAATLAGCGGSGVSTVVSAPIPEYIDLANRDYAVTSQLGGRILLTGDDAAIRAVSAGLLHSEGQLKSFTDGTSTFSDLDGEDASDIWTDGTLTLSPSEQQDGTYKYVALFNFTAETYGGPVVLGVTMDAADIPVEGSYTYTGEAHLAGASTSGGYASLTASGSASVAVDFENGLVNLTINGVSGVPYDSITLNGMEFASDGRNTFSGGTLALFDGTGEVTDDLLGATREEDARGDFYGMPTGTYDQPTEVGGAFYSKGTGGEGEIYGVFLAD